MSWLERPLYLLRSGLWKVRYTVRVALWPRAEIARLEAIAEAAYDAMYDAERYSVRECYDDAAISLMQAIAIADKRGFKDVGERLRARRKHIYNVYDHQFR